MEQRHHFPVGGRRARREKPAPDAPGAPAGDAVGDDARSGPSSPKWDSEPAARKWLADGHLDGADGKVEWRVQGWLAETGTSVWYGAGSTGKTQLMLWMAAMIASRPEDRHEQIWLGARIKGTGHVLILTAEDTREQIMMRLRDVVTHSMRQDGPARQRTCSRLHIMPFLSMSEREFRHPNPSLLQQDKERVWGPSDVMLEIERYVREWNRLHPDEEERIVGVVMDSATSMAGFDSLDAQATTNFFFYLGRLCERLRIFWAVIGHTPKVTSIPRLTARETATSRLRGVAMWTTAPRLTVEVRLIQEWRKGVRVDPEAPALRAWLGGHVRKENILVVYVARLRALGDLNRMLARPVPAAADAAEEVGEVCRAMRASRPLPGGGIALDLAPSVVEGRVARRVALVAAELLENAFRHAVDGGGAGLWVTLRRPSGALVLVVGNDAPPADRAKARSSGLGTGIVAEIVRRAGGTIAVEHRGAGTIARVELPAPTVGCDVD